MCNRARPIVSILTASRWRAFATSDSQHVLASLAAVPIYARMDLIFIKTMANVPSSLIIPTPLLTAYRKEVPYVWTIDTCPILCSSSPCVLVSGSFS